MLPQRMADNYLRRADTDHTKRTAPRALAGALTTAQPLDGIRAAYARAPDEMHY